MKVSTNFYAFWMFLWLTMCCYVETKSDRGCQRQRKRGKCRSTVLLTKTYGSIQSPGYPRSYPNSAQKTWHIRIPKGYRIRVRFRKAFDVENSAMCQKDALIVSFDKTYKDTKLLCGKKRPRALTSSGNELWLKFLVDDAGVGKGFMANYRAIDVNECKKEVCKFPSLCRNTVGSYMCDCPDGYRLRGRKTSGKCVDINECLTSVAKCDFRCVNTAGSYHCVCPRGYKLAYNEKSCRDINECSTGNGGCSHQCRNSRGSFACSCPAGYKLDDSKKLCQKEIFFDSQQEISYVNEDAAPGSLVTKVKAKPNRRVGQSIVYSIVAENLKRSTANPAFTMDQLTGEIRVRARLDREKTTEYLLEIEAKYVNVSNGQDSIRARSFVVVRVLDVNDNAPQFSNPAYTITVSCNVNPGSILFRLQTYDPDDGDNALVTYKIEPANPYFTVQKNSGKVKVLRGLRGFCNASGGAVLKAFEYKVVATDGGVPPLRTRVQLRIIIINAIDLSSQTLFVVYTQGSQFMVVSSKGTSRSKGANPARKTGNPARKTGNPARKTGNSRGKQTSNGK